MRPLGWPDNSIGGHDHDETDANGIRPSGAELLSGTMMPATIRRKLVIVVASTTMLATAAMAALSYTQTRAQQMWAGLPCVFR